MGDAILEFIKTVGSISGIFAAAFLVWDRYVKHFPVAIIVPKPIMPGSRNITHFLCLKNVSDRPILVFWKKGGANQLSIGKDQSTRSIIEAIVEGETTIALGPEETLFLPVFKPRNFPQIDPDNIMEIHLRWRFAQPRIWKADRTIHVWVRKRDWEYMVENLVQSTGDPTG